MVYMEKKEVNIKDNREVSGWTIGEMVLTNIELRTPEKIQI